MARCTHIHLLGGAEQAMLPNRTRPDLVAHLQPLALKGPKLGYGPFISQKTNLEN